MNNPLHHLETLRDNLVKTIADMELMFGKPCLVIDEKNVPDIDKLAEEWKNHSGMIVLPENCKAEFINLIDEKYQTMINLYREHLQFVVTEIFKHKEEMRRNNIRESAFILNDDLKLYQPDIHVKLL